MATIIPFPRRPKQDGAESAAACAGVAAVGNTVILFPGVEWPPAPAIEPASSLLSPSVGQDRTTAGAAKPPKRKRGDSKEEDQRLAMLGKVHIAKKDLMRLPGFDDTVYRHILEAQFGVSSAADLQKWQLHNLLLYFASLGWQAKKGRNRRAAPRALTHDATGMSREARLEKIEAMLAEKGRAEGTDVPWGYAVAILKRHTAHDPAGQVKSFDKATPQQLDDVIAALYKDAKRKGRKVR